MPNIGYLFRGYDILKGNPIDPEQSFDPGFKQMIFKPTYKEQRSTADKRFKIPDNVDAMNKVACKYEFSSEALMTMSAYQETLMAKAHLEGSGTYKIVDASFSVSTEYNRVRKKVESNSKTIMKSEAFCTVYGASLNTGTPPDLSQNFIAYVKDLQERENYLEFLDAFGTHFIESIDMGARYDS